MTAEIDHHTEAIKASSAHLGVVCYRNFRPMIPGTEYALGRMVEYFDSAIKGRQINNSCPVSAEIVEGASRLALINMLTFSPHIDETVASAQQFKATTKGILTGQPLAPKDLEQLANFFNVYHDHHQQAIYSPRIHPYRRGLRLVDLVLSHN